jgi:hypothetical protein
MREQRDEEVEREVVDEVGKGGVRVREAGNEPRDACEQEQDPAAVRRTMDERDGARNDERAADRRADGDRQRRERLSRHVTIVA